MALCGSGVVGVQILHDNSKTQSVQRTVAAEKHKPVSVTTTVSDNAGHVGTAALVQVACSVGLYTNDTRRN